MSAKGRFHIPSIQEMEKSKDSQIKIASLFEAHRHKSGKSNTSQEPVESSCAGSSSLSKPSVGSTQSSTGRKESYISKPTNGNGQQPHRSEVSNPQAVLTSTKTSTIGSTFAQQSVSNTAECTNTAKAAKGVSSLIVSPRQRGNPILKHVRNVPWEFGDIVPDYVMGQSTCALYLSLRYHALNPNYIHERLKQLAHSYQLRVLLAQVDTKDPDHTLKELGKICILTDCTLVLAWTPEEAGRYLETYKSYENKPPDLIMEKTEPNYLSQLTDCLTTVRRVNKTDAVTMLTAFGSVEKMVEASEEDLALCSGLGPQKAKRLHAVFHEPFLVANKRKGHPPSAENEQTGSPRKVSATSAGSPTKDSSAYNTRSPWKKNTDIRSKKS